MNPSFPALQASSRTPFPSQPRSADSLFTSLRFLESRASISPLLLRVALLLMENPLPQPQKPSKGP